MEIEPFDGEPLIGNSLLDYVNVNRDNLTPKVEEESRACLLQQHWKDEMKIFFLSFYEYTLTFLIFFYFSFF